MAIRFKSVIVVLAAVVVVTTVACAGDPASEINRADWSDWSRESKIAESHRAIQVGELELAIQDFGDVIQLDSNDAQAYSWRGWIYGLLGQHANADADKAKQCSLGSEFC